MKSKRGIVEIQFNWIFVLIVGAIILTLFTAIIMKQKNASEISTNILILNSIDAILAGSEVSTGTTNVVRLPKTKIEFDCNSYSIGTVTKQINIMNIFTPSVLEDNTLISMTLDWSIPYRVTNFVYLTNPKIRYVFVGDTSYSDNIFRMIPEKIRGEEAIHDSIQDIQNKNDDRVRIIIFDDRIGEGFPIPNSLSNMIKGSVTALKVSDNVDSGEIEFFNSKDNNFESVGTSYYIGNETLLGAIFTDDLGIYNCVMKNAFKKLNIVSEIYENKRTPIKDEYGRLGNQACKKFYKDDTGRISDNFKKLSILSFPQSASGAEEIVKIADNIKGYNEEAKQLSCALIY